MYVRKQGNKRKSYSGRSYGAYGRYKRAKGSSRGYGSMVPKGNAYFGLKGVMPALRSAVLTETFQITGVSLDTTGIVADLTGGIPHTAGSKLAVWRLKMRIFVNVTGSGSTTSLTAACRLMIINKVQNNGSTTVSNGELLYNGGSNSLNFESPVNADYCPEKYYVLRDFNVTMTPVANTRQAVGATTYDNPGRMYDVDIKWPRGLIVCMTGNAGTAADITRNALTFVGYANNVNMATVSARGAVTYTYG